MRKIITIASQKGGVGKTTTALNLGFSLSRQGHRVLVMEGDPQGALAIAGDLSDNNRRDVIHLLRQEISPDQVTALPEKGKPSLLGSGVRKPADALYLDQAARSGHLGDTIRKLGENFDYILIDAPTGINNISSVLLANSQGVIIPINCRGLSVQTLSLFLNLIQRIRQRRGPSLHLEGLLINMVDNRSAKEIEIYETIRNLFPLPVVFKTYIPFDERFEAASTEGVPVMSVTDGETPSHWFLDLAQELVARESSHTQGGAI